MLLKEKQGKASVWESTWKCFKNNINEIVLVTLVTAALRIAFLLPLLLCTDFGGWLPAWLGYVMAALAYIGGVIPMRFWGGEKLRRMVFSRNINHHRKYVYAKWLLTGFLRYGRGILWGLPFLAGAVYFTVFRASLDVKTFWMPIRSLAGLVGQEPNIDTGFTVALVLMAIFGLMFAYGWSRDLPFEYLPARSLGPKKTLRLSNHILKKYKEKNKKNIFVNFFLALPAWIGLGAVLVPYALSSVDFSMGPEMVLSQTLRLLRSPLPAGVLLLLGGVVLLLYVPGCALRKTRNAVLIGTLLRENAHSVHAHHSSHSSSHQSADAAILEALGVGADTSVPAAPRVREEPRHPIENTAAKVRPAPKAEEKNAPEPDRTDEERERGLESALMAREVAQMAQEAAEQAAKLAQNAARIAQEAARTQNKQK